MIESPMIGPTEAKSNREGVLLAWQAGSCFKESKTLSGASMGWSGMGSLTGFLAPNGERVLVLDFIIWRSDWLRSREIRVLIDRAEIETLYEDPCLRTDKASQIACTFQDKSQIALASEYVTTLQMEIFSLVNVAVCAARDRIEEEGELMAMVEEELAVS